ncbi:MAG: GNAT family N-acetyltransferase [Ancrocorticia sp.]
MAMTYSAADIPPEKELVALYNSVGWTAYSKDPARLAAAVRASLAVVVARDGGEVVGLARVVGDGLTIAYVQDILVAPTHRRRGIGRELFTRVLEPFADVRQKVLMTDGEPAQRAFYKAMGFIEVRDLSYPIRVFVRMG